MAEVDKKRALDGDKQAPPRKKLRLSDLPISQAKRSAIDNLVHTFRKKGEYDAMRKTIFTQFESDVSTVTPPAGVQGLKFTAARQSRTARFLRRACRP
jgi:hypothetical protein